MLGLVEKTESRLLANREYELETDSWWFIFSTATKNLRQVICRDPAFAAVALHLFSPAAIHLPDRAIAYCSQAPWLINNTNEKVICGPYPKKVAWKMTCE
jgi:hypothetical protein